MARNTIEFDDAHIIYRNFSGKASQYNREGDRNFGLILTDPVQAQQLIDEGWNIKVKPPRDEDEDTFYWMPVKVKFGEYPPDVYLVSRGVLTKLDEESADALDGVSIARVDLDIRPYTWSVNGKSGITAYLQGIKVVQNYNRFELSEEPTRE